MRANWKRPALAATGALVIAISSAAIPNAAMARHRGQVVRPVASPPPFGYYGEFPLDPDYAQAQAWSLRPPYYPRFLYDYCDYRNCTLQYRNGNWVPMW